MENDFEEGLRRCSNTMGWFLIYSIKQRNGEHVNYIIKLCKNMLDLSKEMEVSKKTYIFILTLFTTVGMFCCKEKSNYLYLNNILSAIKIEEASIIYTALKIRTFENDMWDELLENKTRQLGGNFKREYEKYKDRNKNG